MPFPKTQQKRCLKCGETKWRGLFDRDKRTPDGYKRWCRTCWQPIYKQREKVGG